jgi:replicative DNA helicase
MTASPLMASLDASVATALTNASSVEAEQAVIGGILYNPAAFARASEFVTAEDFSEGVHRRIFAAMADLVAGGRALSIPMLKVAIGDLDIADGVTVGAYLARCAAGAMPGVMFVEYVKSVRDLAMRRRLIDIAATAIATAGAEGFGFKTPALASQIVADLDEIASSEQPATMRRVQISDAACEAIRQTIDLGEGKAGRGLSTGLRDLDEVLGGLERGQGSVLAGRPSMGKTAIAVDLSLNVSKAGYGVFYVSLEMGGVPLAQRALASMVYDDARSRPIHYSSIARGLRSKAEIDRLERAAHDLSRVKFIIEQQAHLSVSQITARVRQAKAALELEGVDLALVVVDHLGLVASSSRYKGDRVREIGEISSSLHAMARECDVHVMMLSQLSRAIESREDKRPQLHDLRESGEIEQNADAVMGVFREAYYLERGAQTAETMSRLEIVRNQIEIGVLKNRQGPTGPVRLFADIACNAIRGLAP